MSNHSAKPRTQTQAGGAASNAAVPMHATRGPGAVLPTPKAARERQLVLLEALLQLAAQQQQLVHAEDVSDLPEMMSQRQLLIDELLVLDAACQAQAGAASSQAQNEHKALAQLEAKVRELAQRVHDQDKLDLAALELRVQSVAAELGELRSSGRALGAYAAQGSSGESHQPLAQDTTA